MRKTAGIITILLIASSMLFASIEQSPRLIALQHSALRSVSYYGTMGDIAENPASLPLVSGYGNYQVSGAYGERLSHQVPVLSYVDNPEAELKGEVRSGPVALAAKFSAFLDDKTNKDGKANFDVYSGVDMVVSVGYAFLDHFSAGAALGGGNSMARYNKDISGIFEFAGNALFSPFEKIEGSERFTTSLGFLAYYDSFTFGLRSDSILSLVRRSEGGVGKTLSETTVSVSYKGDRYTQDGELSFLVPRASISYSGFSASIERRSLSIKGDLTLQFLKNMVLDGGMVYNHDVLDGISHRTLGMSLYGSYYSYALSINAAYDVDKGIFIPSVVFSYTH